MKSKLWIWLPCLMIMTCFACFGCGGVTELDSKEAIISEESAAEDEEAIIDEEPFDDAEAEEIVEEAGQNYGPALIADLDADYYIDYENGTIPIGDLPIGSRVVDPSWQWDFRTVSDYTYEQGNEIKPVNWIIVAKDHYEGLGSHITLLSEELIGKHAFDDSRHVSDLGSSHWGQSGSHSSADRGLRPWLNSTGIHSGEGFYQAFSANFKSVVLITGVPNQEWVEDNTKTFPGGSLIEYTTSDNVFIPSTCELREDTYYLYQYASGSDEGFKIEGPIGKAFPYFQGEEDAKRLATLAGNAWWYWTRSSYSHGGNGVSGVYRDGEFRSRDASHDAGGVRPAVNLKADTLVSEIRN